MRELLRITKALADENRLRILMMVKDREPCVCQIIEALGTAPSTASKHLSILKAAGLIDSNKKGRWIYYHLPRRPDKLISDTLQWVSTALETSETARRDCLRITNICELDPECLARQQRLK